MKNTIVNTKESKITVESTTKRTNKNCKPVFDITTGTIYASQSDVVKLLKSFSSDVSNACNGKLSSIKGHRLCKLSDIVYHIEELSENMKKYYEIYKRFEKEILEKEIEEAQKEKISCEEAYEKAKKAYEEEKELLLKANEKLNKLKKKVG